MASQQRRLPHPDPNADTDANTYGYSDANADPNADTDANTYGHSDANASAAQADADAKAAAYTVAAPDALSEWVKKLQQK